MSKKFETIGKHRIYLDEMYFLAYAGGKRELPEKEQKEYNKILTLPLVLQRKELKKFHGEKNPNMVPIKGHLLLSFIKELDFVPFFDINFEQSHLCQLSDIVIYESIKQKSYDLALRA